MNGELIAAARRAADDALIRGDEQLAETLNRAIRNYPKIAEVLSVLKYAQEQVGWKGDRGQHPDKYACEHCAAPPELHFADLKHEPHCLVLKIRAVLDHLEAD